MLESSSVSDINSSLMPFTELYFCTRSSSRAFRNLTISGAIRGITTPAIPANASAFMILGVVGWRMMATMMQWMIEAGG